MHNSLLNYSAIEVIFKTYVNENETLIRHVQCSDHV